MRKKAATDKPSRLNPFKNTFPYLVLIILLFLSVLVWQYYKGNTLAREEQRYYKLVDGIISDIVNKISGYEIVLHGGAGVFTASEEVTREDWKAYCGYQQTTHYYPGIQGIGYSQAIQPAELEHHIQSIRAEGFPDYAIRPAGERDEYTAIIFLEPFDARNQRAFGYDMFSEPVRRIAMERARDSGSTSISGMVTLVQESEEDIQRGFLMYVPIYKKNEPLGSPEQRKAAFKGYVYAPFRVRDLMQDIFTDPVHEIDFHLYDGTEVSAETLLYDSHVTPEENHGRRPLFTSTETLDLYGHQWTMAFKSMPAFEAVADRNSHWAVLAAGLLISFMVFFYLKSLQNMNAAISKSEEKHRRLFETMDQGVVYQAADGRIISANPAAEKCLGLTFDQMQGKTSMDPRWQMIEEDGTLVPGEEHPAMIALRTGQTVGPVTRGVYHPDLDSYCWLRITARPLFQPGEAAPFQVNSVFEDITLRKQDEEALRTQEAFLDTILQTTIDGFWVVNNQKRITMVNDAYCDMSGYSREEILSMTINGVEAVENPEETSARIKRIIENGSELFETYHRRKDGTIFPLEISVTYLPENGGQLLCFCRDITERKKTEEEIRKLNEDLEQRVEERTAALKESEEQLKKITDNVTDAVALCNLEGNVTYLSPQSHRVLGFGPEELLGKSIFTIVCEEDLPAVMQQFNDALKAEEPSSSEYRIATKDGRLVWVETRGDLLYENGQVSGVVFVTRDITERKQAEKEVRHHIHRTEALLKIASHLNTELEPGKVRNAICEETCSALHTQMAAYLYYSNNDRCFYLVASLGLPEELARVFAGLSREDYDDIVGKLDKAGAIPDLAAMPELPYAQLLLSHGIKGFIYAVVERDGLPLGIIFAGDAGEEVDIPEDAVALLSGLADQAASALINARLLQETKDSLRQVQSLRNIDMAITGSFDLRVTFQVVLDEVTGMFNTDAAAILLLDPHSDTLKYEQWRGFHSRDLKSITLPPGKGYGGRAASQRQTIHIADLSKVEPEPIQGPLLAEEGFAAYFAVPLVAKGTVRGVLEVYHREPVETDVDWLAFLETLAGQTAIAVDNAELFSRLEHSSLDLLQAYDTTIEGWAHALDLKDEETEDHSRRVTELTVNIARKMDVKQEELAHVRRGALLHDIGKMGIPDAILLKPGKLTDEEWVIMRMHPVYAYEMLAPVDYLRPALDIPYCHHEKWDGSGYPRGLKGKAIPLPARIFAVVDVYDALTSNRPYRKAWSKEKTLALIKEDSGKHFDPEVVEVFLKTINHNL